MLAADHLLSCLVDSQSLVVACIVHGQLTQTPWGQQGNTWAKYHNDTYQTLLTTTPALTLALACLSKQAMIAAMQAEIMTYLPNMSSRFIQIDWTIKIYNTIVPTIKYI